MPGKHKRYSSWGSIWEWSMNLLEKTFSHDKTFDDISWVEKFRPIRTIHGYNYKKEYNDGYNDGKRNHDDDRNDEYNLESENDNNAEAEHQQDEYEDEDLKIPAEIRHDSHRPLSWRISQESHQALPWRFSQFSATFIHHDGQLPEIRIQPPSDDSDDEPRRYNYQSDEEREEYVNTYYDDGYPSTDDNDEARNSLPQSGGSDSPTLGRVSRFGRYYIRQTRLSMSPPIRSARASLIIEESQHQWWQRSQQQHRIEEAVRPQPPAVIDNLGSKVTSVYSFADRDMITCQRCTLRRRNRRY